MGRVVRDKNTGELRQSTLSDTGFFEKQKIRQAKSQISRLEYKSSTFQSAIRNLDKVLDEYLGEKKLAKYSTSSVQDKEATAKAVAEYERKKEAAEAEAERTGKRVKYVTPVTDAAWRSRGEIKKVKTLKSGNLNYKRRMVNRYDYLDDVFNEAGGQEQYNSNLKPGEFEYLFKNGAMYLNMRKKGNRTVAIPDSMKKRYYISWGWFEDFILNSFFRTRANGRIIQEIRSISKLEKVLNSCHISDNLFSTGLQSVILPSRHHPALRADFSKNEQLLSYSTSDKIKLARVRQIYDIIDENFTQFNVGNKGIIRNMVFPIGMFQKHFQNISTVRQGMQSFWAEVSGQYGNFFNFQISQDQHYSGRIGIVDLLYTDKSQDVDPSISDNQSDRTTFKNYKYRPGDSSTTVMISKNAYEKKENPSDEDILTEEYKKNPEKFESQPYNKMFTFSLYSKDSIVKSFSLELKLTSKAATLVNYGTNTNIVNGISRSGDQKDLGLIAYAYLLRKDREKVLKSDNDNSNPLNKSDAVLHDLYFEIDKNDGKGVGTKASDYKTGENDQTSLTALHQVRDLTESEGIEFTKISSLKNDADEIYNKVQSGKVIKDGGIGIYDENGNMTPHLRQLMNYIINYSLHEGDDSNIQRTKPVIPIALNMTLDGIGGLKPGDMFRVDYLPKVYRDFAYFQIFEVNHSMGTSGWETKITAQMKLDLPKMQEAGYVTKTKKRDFKLGSYSEKVEEFYKEHPPLRTENSTITKYKGNQATPGKKTVDEYKADLDNTSMTNQQKDAQVAMFIASGGHR